MLSWFSSRSLPVSKRCLVGTLSRMALLNGFEQLAFQYIPSAEYKYRRRNGFQPCCSVSKSDGQIEGVN
jgi:hypothetical protein